VEFESEQSDQHQYQTGKKAAPQHGGTKARQKQKTTNKNHQTHY